MNNQQKIKLDNELDSIKLIKSDVNIKKELGIKTKIHQ